jgi:hypothetical protein
MQEGSLCSFIRMRVENLARAIESEILPLLRKQPGFRDELVLINPTAKQAEAISLWNS